MWKGSIWSHKNFFLWYTGINTLYLLPKICINCCFQFLLERRFIPKGNWKHWFMHIFGGTQRVSWEQWKQSIHIPFTFIEHFLINYMDTWLIILKELTMTFTALQCFCWRLFYIGLWAILWAKACTENFYGFFLVLCCKYKCRITNTNYWFRKSWKLMISFTCHQLHVPCTFEPEEFI